MSTPNPHYGQSEAVLRRRRHSHFGAKCGLALLSEWAAADTPYFVLKGHGRKCNHGSPQLSHKEVFDQNKVDTCCKLSIKSE
jgi:hypothetical protein